MLRVQEGGHMALAQGNRVLGPKETVHIQDQEPEMRVRIQVMDQE
jgi:hypothetical protein